MTNIIQTSVQTIPIYGQQTSLDLARQRAIPTLAAGVKRSYSEYVGQALQPPPSVSRRKEVQPTQNALQASRILTTADPESGAVQQGPSEYSQRVAVKSTPEPSQNPLLSLSHARYGLPSALVSNFEELGVRSIYLWQSACLLGKGLLFGEANLIYTAPTGGGKSLIADVLLLKKIIDNPTKKAILVLPYVALVQEKLRWLRKATENVSKNADAIESHPQTKSRQIYSSIRAAGFFGGSRAKATWSDIDVAVCTIEKANSLVNAAIEEGTIDQLGVVVLDELHMLDDENRGYLMELMITKLLSLDHGIQLIGMSATLSNPKMLADWMQAKFYISKYQPIPILEYLVYDNGIYSTQNTKDFFRTASQLNETGATQKPPKACHTVEVSKHKELESAMNNAVVALAVETADKGYGALVFCSSRQGSQTMASLMTRAMPPCAAEMLDKRIDTLAALQALPGGFESTFSKTIISGVGFHHAGLTVEERDIVAEAYVHGTKIDWQAFRQQLDTLDDSGLRALRCVGINPAFVNNIVTSGAELPIRTEDEINHARIYSRAYAAFQLRDICNEIPIHQISNKYEVPRGSVQKLAQICHGFVAGMIKFCERMGWGMLAAVLEHMIDRLRAGARADLLEMAQVVFVKSRMARILWESGFKSVRALAEARVEDLVLVMMQAQGRKAKVKGEVAEKLKERLREKAEVIVGSANRLWEKQQLDLVQLEE